MYKLAYCQSGYITIEYQTETSQSGLREGVRAIYRRITGRLGVKGTDEEIREVGNEGWREGLIDRVAVARQCTKWKERNI